MTTRAERATRDTLILRLHLAGHSYRAIGQKVDLSIAGVFKVVQRELRQSADRRGGLNDEAVEQYLARVESLLAASMPKALAGEPKSVETCRRLLDGMARVQGLFPSLAERLLPSEPMSDVDIDDDGLTDLDRYRRERQAKYEA